MSDSDDTGIAGAADDGSCTTGEAVLTSGSAGAVDLHSGLRSRMRRTGPYPGSGRPAPNAVIGGTRPILVPDYGGRQAAPQNRQPHGYGSPKGACTSMSNSLEGEGR